jgi:hypothetical protein
MEKEQVEERVFRKRRIQKAARAAARPSWGQPAPCPACGFFGVLLHVDPVQVVMRLACRRCGTEWRLGEADVDNPPDAKQRARALALKHEEAAVRNARLAAAEAEGVWQSRREIEAGGTGEPR